MYVRQPWDQYITFIQLEGNNGKWNTGEDWWSFGYGTDHNGFPSIWCREDSRGIEIKNWDVAT